MIRSMTGFGRAQASVEGFNITAEIKSVNHRYFEFSARLPRAYNFLEEKIKSFKTELSKLGESPEIITISSVTNTGLDNLKNKVWQHLEKTPKTPEIEVELKNFDTRDRTSLNITRQDDASFVVTGGYVDNLVRGIVLSDFNSFSYFQMRLKRDGVIDKLKEKGMKSGDLVKIKDIEFIYED